LHRFIIRQSLLKNIQQKAHRHNRSKSRFNLCAILLCHYSLEIEFLHEKLGSNQHSSCRASLLTIQQFYCINILPYEIIFVKCLFQNIWNFFVGVLAFSLCSPWKKAKKEKYFAIISDTVPKRYVRIVVVVRGRNFRKSAKSRFCFCFNK